MPLALQSVPDIPPRTYDEVRPEIRSGDLLLCAGTSVMSRLIQHATACIWSHVALIIRVDAIDRVMVLESVETIGVRCIPLSHYLHDHNASGKPYPGELLIARHDAFERVAQQHLLRAAQWAADLLARPYDKDEIVRIAARIAIGSLVGGARDRVGGRSASPVRDDAYICSEYVWECCRAAGIDIAPDPRGFIAPRDFAADPHVRALCRLRIGPS